MAEIRTMHPEPKMIWFDQSANAGRLSTPEGVARMVERCAEAGITDLLVNVRSPDGLALYRSRLVPHRSLVHADYPADYDLLALVLEEGHRRGLRVHAAPDVFSGGRWSYHHPAYAASRHPDWQSVVYGLDPASLRPACFPYTKVPKGLVTAVPINNEGVGFLNPGHPEVQEHLLAVLEELAREYPVDGFCLDRGRYDGLHVDFSEHTRRALAERTGEPLAGDDWPERVYRILRPGEEEGPAAAPAPDRHGGVTGYAAAEGGTVIPGTRCAPGPLFGAWLEYRAAAVRSFFVAARQRVKAVRPDVLFGDYTGSWYPLYYQVGVNWASRRYDPGLPFLPPTYQETGYAEQLDYLCSGCYYPEVTVAEARAKGAPADWYSVEGAADLAVGAVMGDTPLIGSLFLQQYEGDVAQYQKAVAACRTRTAGVMLFDLCYVDGYDWWEATRAALR
ncbi:hypothetical protein J2Z79_003053 [Symbiobacterium terraclitae]|uniref:Glycosyl hydrolase-like 10 domain-containing protein n=1 Tax=Symbiobacterium terraclitae TaxID=557451 RepID=A0ABS4JXA4_9FIRM|nr:alpha amylase family protein [Symbiobacterium terraclitae]MBP2019611.1 hypothetical protein [Symbiobacterium terraclitae]